MPMQVNSPGWRVRSATRGGAAAPSALQGLPSEYSDRRFARRRRGRARPGAGESRRCRRGRSGRPQRRRRTRSGRPARDTSSERRPHVPSAGRVEDARHARLVAGAVSGRHPERRRRRAASSARPSKRSSIKAAKLAGDKLVSLLLPKLVEAFEKRSWAKRGLKEGWLHVTRQTLADEKLLAGTPVSPKRSLLFIHGTFSNAVGGFQRAWRRPTSSTA